MVASQRINDWTYNRSVTAFSRNKRPITEPTSSLISQLNNSRPLAVFVTTKASPTAARIRGRCWRREDEGGWTGLCLRACLTSGIALQLFLAALRSIGKSLNCKSGGGSIGRWELGLVDLLTTDCQPRLTIRPPQCFGIWDRLRQHAKPWKNIGVLLSRGISQIVLMPGASGRKAKLISSWIIDGSPVQVT